jgi:hypothetical protein
MTAFTLTLSHPYKGMRERTTTQAVGKEPPSLGSGGVLPSLPLGAGGTEGNEENEEAWDAWDSWEGWD